MICKLKQHNLLITFLLHILVSVEMLQICLRTGNFHLHYDSMRNTGPLWGVTDHIVSILKTTSLKIAMCCHQKVDTVIDTRLKVFF